ncbi:MAG: very short patch repair endonuclease [Acidimicrobiia bacterium]
MISASKDADQYPHPTSEAVTASMKGNRRADTKPETELRSQLHRRGYRFRKDLRIGAGDGIPRPDIVFRGSRVAVFVDGCFWHQCPEHGHVPGGKNAAYWQQKMKRNVSRDLSNTRALEEEGWHVIRIWEHESIDEAVARVDAALKIRAS